MEAENASTSTTYICKYVNEKKEIETGRYRLLEMMEIKCLKT